MRNGTETGSAAEAAHADPDQPGAGNVDQQTQWNWHSRRRSASASSSGGSSVTVTQQKTTRDSATPCGSETTASTAARHSAPAGYGPSSSRDRAEGIQNSVTSPDISDISLPGGTQLVSSRLGDSDQSKESTTPNIVITQPSFISEPLQAATESSEDNMSHRARASSSASHSASLRLVRATEDDDRVPFPLTVPTPTRSRHDSGRSSSVRLTPQRPPSSRYAPARSSFHGFEAQHMAEVSRPHHMSFHTDTTGQYIEIPRFKKRELNLSIVRHRGIWDYLLWTTLWVGCAAHSLLSLFFDVNVFYMILQAAMYPPYQPNSRQLWIFAGVCYALCWAISIIGVWLAWELWYNSWRSWNRRFPAIEPIYFSLAASTHLSLWSFDHFVFLLHIRLSPLGTMHASDIIPETAYSLLQLLPGLLPLGVRAGVACVLLMSFWQPEALVPAGIPVAAVHRDPNFFKIQDIGELTMYSKSVLLAFVCWAAFRVFVVLASAVLLWLYSCRPFARLRSWSAQSRPNSSHLDPSDWNAPAKTWRDETEFQWGWRERSRARIQNAFELCMVRPRYMSEKIPDVYQPATPGSQEVLNSPLHTPTSYTGLMRPVSSARTPDRFNPCTPTTPTGFNMNSTPTPTPTGRKPFYESLKASLNTTPRSPVQGMERPNGQPAVYREVVVEDALYRVSEESERTAASSVPRWKRNSAALSPPGAVITESPEQLDPVPLTGTTLPSPADYSPRTPADTPAEETIAVGLGPNFPRSRSEIDLVGLGLGEEPVKKPLGGLPPPRPPVVRSVRMRGESSDFSGVATGMHTREASAESASTASMSMRRFQNYTGTPPPVRRRLSDGSFEFDARSQASGQTNDDLCSLQQYIEREATPSPQLSGTMAFIRFKALSREGDNSFERGEGYGRSLHRPSRSSITSSSISFPQSQDLHAAIVPSSRIRISATATQAHLVEAQTVFPRLGLQLPPPLPARPPSTTSSRVPASTVSSTRAQVGSVGSRTQGSSVGSRAPASSAGSRAAGSSVGSKSATTSTGGRPRGPRPPNIILPPNPVLGVDVAVPNEFGQYSPQQPRSPASPTISTVGLSLIPPSPSTVEQGVWPNLAPRDTESPRAIPSRRGSHISAAFNAAAASPSPQDGPQDIPHVKTRSRQESALGLEFETVPTGRDGSVHTDEYTTETSGSRQTTASQAPTPARYHRKPVPLDEPTRSRPSPYVTRAAAVQHAEGILDRLRRLSDI